MPLQAVLLPPARPFPQRSRDSSVSRCSMVTVAGVAGVRHACNLYNSACNSTSLDQLRTSSLYHRCLGSAALLQLPLSAVPVYIVYPIVHTCYNLVHFYLCTLLHYYCTTTHLMHLHACTAPREPHFVHISCTSTHAPRAHLMHLYLCTSMCAPHLVHISSCTSTHEPHLVNLTSCTSCACLRMHLYVCTSTHAPHLVNLTSCTSTRAPHLVNLT